MNAAAAKKDIRKVSPETLKTFLQEHGEAAFRGKQIQEWLWKKSVTSFGQMTSLSAATRQLLADHFEIRPLTVETEQISADRTIKSAFRLHDGKRVEGVLIPAEERMTACVSSQVGCSLTCSFCATGYMDRERNLEAAEIYDQVVAIDRQAREHYGQPLSNIVYMGMGEPLLNYASVLESVAHITSPEGLGWAARRITVSTAGIAKMIKKLGDDGVRFNLALSLHAADDAKRSQIMPINESNTLAALREALLYFYQKTRNKITLEYIVFYHFNDSPDDARLLARFARQVPGVHINLIEYNPIEQAGFRNTDPETLSRFARFLESQRLSVTVRRSRGKDIDAACGQLAGKVTTP